ncbi:amidase [Nocardia asteroides]|uniref:amidase n=1 Tax=Nocardia asteroides TaxID=1824 RepID=UPI001E3A41E0|nr:amidase [Nocardia asteroides]UGT61444.1 amidase [Nocardia asteroides]
MTDSTAAPLPYAGVAETAAEVRAGKTTAAEAVDQALERIERAEPRLRAFPLVLAERARAEAAERDARQAAGAPLGPLHGVPIAVKDELDVAGAPTGYGGVAAGSGPAAADAEVVRRLRAAGAVIVGKTAMPEFGIWPYTESAAVGHTRNPWSARHTPGGSSGGSAAAVAAGLVPAATGADSGGSIRIPAACCGVFGLKPQRGRVSSAPRPDLWGALGTIGVLTRTVADSALLYDVLAGTVAADRWHAPAPTSSYTDLEPGPRLRIGLLLRTGAPGITAAPSCVAAVRETAEALAGLGHEIVEDRYRLPDPTDAFLPQVINGVRVDARRMPHPELLEPRTRAVIRLGRVTVPPAVLRWSERRGERLTARVNGLFDRYDLLLTPTLAGPPPPIGRLDGTGMVRATLRTVPMIAYTALWNVCGNPAAAVPAGFADGLPRSVQLVGPPNDEHTVLRVAAELERVRPWTAVPPG